jgi:hypothetical protein
LPEEDRQHLVPPRRAWSRIGHKEQRQADLQKGEEGKVGNMDLSEGEEMKLGSGWGEGDAERGR